MSRIATLSAILDGAHVMDEDGLRNYHVARRVINANRLRSGIGARFMVVRHELKNYRVMVAIRDNDVRVYRPDTQAEWFLARSK